jgi:hypothetical protein
MSHSAGRDQDRPLCGAWLVKLAAFALPLFVYLLTMAPTITWAHDGADGGDLITAAYTLGVPHPPGYPVYCLLGWLFAHLPLREVAWRLNLMSAVGAALAALGLCATILEWQGVKGEENESALVAGLGAAWGIAFMPALWSQALIAEVYAVNAAFVALVLWLAFLVRRSSAPPVVLGLIWGLSLGVHLTCVALLPVVVWALAARWRGRLFLGATLPWLLGTILGLSVYAYLPLRAGQGAITWGNPRTLEGWWWMVSGALYRHYVLALPLGAVPARLVDLARRLTLGFSPVGVALGVIGIDSLRRRRSDLFLASGLSWLLYAGYAIGYDTTDSYVYLIPAFVIFAFWLGEGLAESLRWLQSRRGRRWGLVLGACLACVGPLSTLVLNYQGMNVHRDRLARDFGAEVMDAAPERAVLLSAQDAHTFTLWYFQHVLGRRPDVTVVDTGLLRYDWYLSNLMRIDPGFAVPEGDVEDIGADVGRVSDVEGLGQANFPRQICEVVEEEVQRLRCGGSE